MAPTVFDNGGGNYGQLCSRCFAEINRMVIDSNGDTVSTFSPKLGRDDGLLSLRNKKRKCIFTDTLDGAIIDELHGDISSTYADVGENVKGSSGNETSLGNETPSGNETSRNEVTSDEPANETNVSSFSFNQIVIELEHKIRALGLPKKEATAIFALVSSLQNKYSPDKQSKSNRCHPHPGKEIEDLLRGLSENPTDDERKRNMGKTLEEDRHPWGALRKEHDEFKLVQDSPPAPKILMRVWDDRSQARIREANEGFLSGSNYMPLHTMTQRKAAIENHANWRNRKKTAFISATTDIEDLAYCLAPRIEGRQKRNGLLSITKITLINGNADGMPILPIRKEMNFYKCHNAYESNPSNLRRIEKIEQMRIKGKDVPKNSLRQSWYEKEHLFLFRIPKEQIVMTWLWKDVQKWMTDRETEDIKRWYDEVLVPEYNKHEHKRRFGPNESSIHKPNCACCGH